MTPPDPQDGASAPSDDARADRPSTPGHGGEQRPIWIEFDQSSIMTVELISAILVWGGIGYALDHFLGTAPWLMGIGVLMGFAAGLYLVWLRSMRDEQHGSTATQPRPRHDDPRKAGERDP